MGSRGGKIVTDWKNWTPKHDGHAPDDWDGREIDIYNDTNVDWLSAGRNPIWLEGCQYRYWAKKPNLLAQCLDLPQADRDALIEALQKPQRDWADDVWMNAFGAYEQNGYYNPDRSAAVIRSMCRPKEEN